MGPKIGGTHFISKYLFSLPLVIANGQLHNWVDPSIFFDTVESIQFGTKGEHQQTASALMKAPDCINPQELKTEKLWLAV